MVRKGARWLERALAVVGLVMIVYHAAFDISVVTSESMAPTLLGRNVESGDWVLTEKVSYWFRDPHRWEVVRLRTEKGDSIVKRVVGLPGEEMSVRDKIPVIDGQPTPPPRRLAFLKYWALGNLFQGASVPCGDGFYVMGDDSRDSQDSRFEGPVKREEIQGRIMFIVWPLYRFGPVSPNT
jgi:signal peptidase I